MDSRVVLAYCSYEEAQYLFRQAAELGLLGPGYIWMIPSLAVGNPDSPPPDSFPIGVIGVITEQWRKSLRQRVREGVAIVAKGAESFKKLYGFIPEGHGDCTKPSKHSDNHTLFRWGLRRGSCSRLAPVRVINTHFPRDFTSTSWEYSAARGLKCKLTCVNYSQRSLSRMYTLTDSEITQREHSALHQSAASLIPLMSYFQSRALALPGEL